MEDRVFEIINDELRELRNLTIETRNLTIETRRMADEIRLTANETREMTIEAKRKADAAWELVTIAKLQMEANIADLRLPWWKKLVGINYN
ncbi:MAG: hypothetical protein ACKVOU_05765 [Cytophagales bacterium]